MDFRLEHLLDVVEKGEHCTLVVNLVVGSWVVVGRPVSEDTFMRASIDSMTAGRIAVQSPQTRKQIASEGEGSPTFAAIAQVCSNELQFINAPVPPQAQVLNLLDAQFHGGIGSVQTRAVRIPLSAISAFWVSQWEHKPGGTGLSVGVAF